MVGHYKKPLASLPEMRNGFGCQQWEVGLGNTIYSSNTYNQGTKIFFHSSERMITKMSVHIKKKKIVVIHLNDEC